MRFAEFLDVFENLRVLNIFKPRSMAIGQTNAYLWSLNLTLYELD